MNIYAIIILTTIVIDFILNIVSEILNLKNLSGKLPDEFNNVYDADKYSKSQEYTRVKTHFGFVVTGVSLILTLVFWFAGGFNFLDNIVRGWDLHPIWTGLAYIVYLLYSNHSSLCLLASIPLLSLKSGLDLIKQQR